MTYNGSEYFYLTNLQGDVTGLANASGATVVSYTYDSWGKLISTTGPLATTLGVKNPYRYRGYRYDTETGLYYLQSRYYNPEIGRFINADDTASLFTSLTTISDKNLFIYSDNNPVNRVDVDGYIWETIFDVLGIGWSTMDFVHNPSWKNAGYLAWDIGATIIPIVPGSYAKKGIYLANKADDVMDASKAAKRAGRSGKQAQLRRMAVDDKISSTLRGEIKRDINQIKRGKRKTIRVPRGYELAHKRGFEARKGYSYAYTVLQTIKNHRTQHKYDIGRQR